MCYIKKLKLCNNYGLINISFNYLHFKLMADATLSEVLVQSEPDVQIEPEIQIESEIRNNLIPELTEFEQELIARQDNERNEALQERQRIYEENNPPKEMTIQLILWRMTHFSLLNDLLHLAMLYAYCTLEKDVIDTLVLKCILLKIVLWVFPFFTRMFVQPCVDYQKLGQSFRPTEMNQFTIASAKASGGYHMFMIFVFFFADVIIINQFIPIQNSCDPYPINMCIIQKTYSIICIFAYSLLMFCMFGAIGVLITPSLKTKFNEWIYLLNVAGLKHLTISENDDDKECAICYEVMKEATVLPCGHKFCDNCVQPWIKEKGTCPTCSQPAFSKKTTDLHVYDEGHKYIEETKDDKTELHPLDAIV